MHGTCIKIINTLLLRHLSLSNPYSTFLLFLISSIACLNLLALGRTISLNSFNFNCNSLPDSFILSIFFYTALRILCSIIIVVLFILSRQLSTLQYLQSGHQRFLPHPLKFINHLPFDVT
jgi:hypothetical protein